MPRTEEIELVRQARPFLRGILAFLFCMRQGFQPKEMDCAHSVADAFLNQLEADLKAQE